MAFTTLISAADLAQHINQKNWIILDCRHELSNPDAGRNAFAAGHIPGAQLAHLDQDLAGNTMQDGVLCGRHPLPERATFIAKLRSWGINDDTQVITYDAHGGMFAARCWWMLRWVGHAAVAVLDGGLPAWAEPLTQEIRTPQPGTISEKKSLVSSVNAQDVLANLASQKRIVVDARSPERFRGEGETMDKVGGHIPGAKNRFFKDNLQADGRFKSADQLRAEWSAFIQDPQQAVMQCGSGVTACHNLLALEIAGLSGAALYPGSWSEWSADPARPMVT
jgi:thiosulfate/3-mercaptopyruvate sulfurtransferase